MAFVLIEFALRYRKFALQEPDKEKTQLLQLIADESERDVLVTAEWLAPRPVLPRVERKEASGRKAARTYELRPTRATVSRPVGPPFGRLYLKPPSSGGL
jgi:hypothetical protein